MIVELYNQEIIKKSLKFYKDKKIFKKNGSIEYYFKIIYQHSGFESH